MTKLRFRDRFFTPPVGRALVSPWSIVLLVAVIAIGIVVDLPVVAACGIGIAAYAGKVLLSVPKNTRGPRIDPFVLSEPWRRYVQGALSAKLRFDRTVAGTRDGPIKDRLSQLSNRLLEGIDESWRIASRGDEIDAALGRLNIKKAEFELAQLQLQPGDRPDVASTIESLEAQISSGLRMENVSATAQDRLRLLDARFDELVARAAEVSIGAADSGALGNDVEDLVTELEGLRLAIEDTRQSEAPDLPPATLQPPDVDGSEQKPQTWPQQ